MNEIDLEAVHTKLTAARTRLILDKPFLGALVLRLPMKAAKDDWCPTTATDAKTFYFNPEYIHDLSLDQTQFMLSHEALHCALSHFSRRQHRIKHRWDLACDFAINPLLIDDGLVPPPNAQVLREYAGMTAEEIYPLIDDLEDMETLDQHVYDQENQNTGGSGSLPPQDKDTQGGQQQDQEQTTAPASQAGQQDPEDSETQSQPSGEGKEASSQPADAPPPLSNEERETLQIQWQQRMAGAAQQAMQAGKLSGALARIIDHLLQPQLPWRLLLARYMTESARDDFSYMRPSRREGNAIFPSLKSEQIDIAIAVDTSGSIKAAEVSEFLSEVSALKGQLRARITLIPCDSKIMENAPFFYEPWDDITLDQTITGGGGTDFRPVFNWLDETGKQPDLLVYFTDAEGNFPDIEPNFPVIWLVKGRKKTPWGQRIQLN